MTNFSIGLRDRSRALLRNRLASLGMVDAASVTSAEDALQRELDLIEHYDIAPLFAFLCDYAAALARNDILAQAIGYAGGSMILFASGLSHVFPPDEGLLFEHFFDGSKFYSGGRKLYLPLDVPTRMNRRLLAAWEHKARSIKANGLGVRIECMPRRYLSLYRRLRRKAKLLPPTRIRSYWPQVDPGRIIPTATRFFAQDYVETSWAQDLSPLTWSQLVLLCSGRTNHAGDAQLLNEIAAAGQRLRQLDFVTRAEENQRLVQAALWYKEDVMAHAQRAIGVSPSLVSRLIHAIFKQQQEHIDQFKETFFTVPVAKNLPPAEIEAEFDLVVSRAWNATSKAHSCCRALWVAYLAYAIPFAPKSSTPEP